MSRRSHDSSSLFKLIRSDIYEIPRVQAGDNTELSNYRPIFVLRCFSKILECVMYKHLYKYLLNSQILCKRQFGFQEGHSTDHAILQLVAQMHNNLN